MTRPARMAVADAFPAICEAAGLPRPVPEYRFAPPRRWRFDYAWPEPEHKVALEVEGGIWTAGRHVRGRGYTRDIEKYNAATLAGWRVLRTTPRELASAATLEMLRRALREAGAPIETHTGR